MMSLEELQTSSVNLDTAKEALAQSEKRLGEAFEWKKAVEQKATVLFGAYVTISLALFGFGGTLVRDANLSALAWPFFVAGLIFVCGAAVFVSVFRTAEYGNLGSEPSVWLRSGLIDGDEPALARALAYLVHDYTYRIDKSFESSESKSRSLHLGMYIGVGGALALLLATVVTYFCPYPIHP